MMASRSVRNEISANSFRSNALQLSWVSSENVTSPERKAEMIDKSGASFFMLLVFFLDRVARSVKVIAAFHVALFLVRIVVYR